MPWATPIARILVDLGQFEIDDSTKDEKEKTQAMPHVILKLYPGRTEEKKKQLADAIAEKIVEIAECKPTSVSVAIEEVPPEQWPEKVYRTDILEKQESLYRKPGYNPFE